MQAQVLQHFPFAQKQRKPNDVILSEDWMATTDAVRASLVSGGYVRLLDDGEAKPQRRTPARDTATASEALTDSTLLLQEISAKQDRILGMLSKLAGTNEGAAPKKARAKAKAKKKAKPPVSAGAE